MDLKKHLCLQPAFFQLQSYAYHSFLNYLRSSALDYGIDGNPLCSCQFYLVGRCHLRNQSDMPEHSPDRKIVCRLILGPLNEISRAPLRLEIRINEAVRMPS